MVHNAYREPGGEDAVHEAERDLMRKAGHSVITHLRSNREIDDYGRWRRATLALRTVWAWDSHRDLKALLHRERPDVAHFTNTFPLISPSAYDACRNAGVAVVQSLHNYRLACPAATFLRRGRVCEECVDHSLARSVRYACYTGSRRATAVTASMLKLHRMRGTWSQRVDRYVALTRFARSKLAATGIPAAKISVKPNFVDPDPGERQGPGECALFVGRLSPEKGLHELLDVWERLDTPVPLRIAGDGPLRIALQARVAGAGLANVEFLGPLPRSEVFKAMGSARFLVVPSLWYEGFPLVIAEAFARGVPVIASRLGALLEIVEEGRTGLHASPADADDWAQRVSWAWSDPDAMAEMGHAARLEWETRYTAQRNAARLQEIYEEAIAAG